MLWLPSGAGRRGDAGVSEGLRLDVSVGLDDKRWKKQIRVQGLWFSTCVCGSPAIK